MIKLNAMSLVGLLIIFLFLTSCVVRKPVEQETPEPIVEEPTQPSDAEDQGEDDNLDDVFSDGEEVEPPIIPA